MQEPPIDEYKVTYACNDHSPHMQTLPINEYDQTYNVIYVCNSGVPCSRNDEDLPWRHFAVGILTHLGLRTLLHGMIDIPLGNKAGKVSYISAKSCATVYKFLNTATNNPAQIQRIYNSLLPREYADKHDCEGIFCVTASIFSHCKGIRMMGYSDLRVRNNIGYEIVALNDPVMSHFNKAVAI